MIDNLNPKIEGFPALFTVWDADTGHLRAWCPKCQIWHTHGDGDAFDFAEAQKAGGHRGAHCVPDDGDGYWLVVMCDAEDVEWVHQDLSRRKPKGPPLAVLLEFAKLLKDGHK
ncbi:MAG: hypothetical protein ACK5XB_05850 [Rhodospirillales bacterium]|jgi:hypothetical protein